MALPKYTVPFEVCCSLQVHWPHCDLLREGPRPRASVSQARLGALTFVGSVPADEPVQCNLAKGRPRLDLPLLARPGPAEDAQVESGPTKGSWKRPPAQTQPDCPRARRRPLPNSLDGMDVKMSEAEGLPRLREILAAVQPVCFRYRMNVQIANIMGRPHCMNRMRSFNDSYWASMPVMRPSSLAICVVRRASSSAMEACTSRPASVCACSTAAWASDGSALAARSVSCSASSV